MLRGRLKRRVGGRSTSSSDSDQQVKISKEALQKAREIVQKEIQVQKRELKKLKEENQRQQKAYKTQEKALKEELTKVRNQLEQRRDTLLATTSLFDYTRTIQGTSTLRLPAALLTLQARLCLHVHCLCVHEELLIQTKEQGWDVIAWMEDVSKQLTFITQQQVLSLQQELISTTEHLQQEFEEDSTTEESIIPKDILDTVQDAKAYLEYTHEQQQTLSTNHLQQKTPSSAEILDQLPYDQQQQHDDNGIDDQKSFAEFLHRYQQRKQNQQKVEQARLAEFRLRGRNIGSSISSSLKNRGIDGSRLSNLSIKNPYRNLHKAPQVAKNLKSYASNLLKNPNQNNDNSTTSSNTMDESFNASALMNDDQQQQQQQQQQKQRSNSNNSVIPNVKPKQWIRQGKNFVKEHYNSDSNLLDNSLSSLGSSLRGLRFRGGTGGGGNASCNASGHSNNTANDKTTPKSVAEDEADGGEQEQQEENSFHEEEDDNHIDNGDEGDDDESIGHDELLADLPSIGANNNSASHDDDDDDHDSTPSTSTTTKQRPSKGRLSGLKQKLRNRPVVQKFFESATW